EGLRDREIEGQVEAFTTFESQLFTKRNFLMTQKFQTNRRTFLKTTTAGAAAISAGAWTGVQAQESKSPNQKLNIACIGTANRAAADIQGVQGENIVALVDVDKNYLERKLKEFPNARTYAD